MEDRQLDPFMPIYLDIDYLYDKLLDDKARGDKPNDGSVGS